MLKEINTWSDYRTTVREFDAILEHGKAVLAALAGVQAPSPQASYGVSIYAKLLGHCVALRKLAADPQEPMPEEAWDLPSMSALARCVIESHDTYQYIAGHVVSDEERGFRIRLWELHDATKRLRLLGEAGTDDPLVKQLQADAARLQAALESHSVMASLPSVLRDELRRRFERNDAPPFHLGLRQRCTQSGVNHDWHNAITQRLSQQAHTLPFSVHQLPQFRAGTPEALRLMSLPLAFALPFLARTVHAVVQLIPAPTPEPPSRTARTMAAWRALAEQSI